MRPEDGLFIQGAGDMHAPLGSAHLAAYLQQQLGPEIEIAAPEMPDPEEPSYRAWGAAIGEALAAAGPGAILIGHSFGHRRCSAGSARATTRQSAVSSLSRPVVGRELPEYELPDGFEERLPAVAATFLYHSRDDPEVPFKHLAEYERVFPEATVRPLEVTSTASSTACPSSSTTSGR